jgi:hypothetical protein
MKPKRRRGDKIKVNLKEVGREVVNSINVVQNRIKWNAFVSTATNIRVL